jgi:hypothetical protein
MASLLTTCMKMEFANACVFTAVGRPREDIFWQYFNATVMTLSLSSQLGQLFQTADMAAPMPAAAVAAGAKTNTKDTKSDGNISRGSSASSAREWMVLTARGLVQLSAWLIDVEQLDPAESRGASACSAKESSQSSQDAAWLVLHTTGGMLPVKFVFEACSSALVWLSSQLSSVGVPGIEGPNPEAAAQAAQLLQQQQLAAAQQALQAAAAQLGGVTKTGGVTKAGDTAEQQAIELGDDTSDCWVQLRSFAAGLLKHCPATGSCNNNLLCHTFSKLSEWQCVGGKACVGSGCGVARYCSKECQNLEWRKNHKPACKRLRAVQQGVK